jgi:Leucine-rich repeat (LRR) protein
LKILDVSENQIERVSKEISNMGNIEQLYMKHNKLKKLPVLEKCFKLKVGKLFVNLES